MRFIDKLLLKTKPVEIVRRSGFFDAQWYKQKYNITTDPASHYYNHGWKDSYNPSDRFSTKDYLINNPDIQNINPLVHYEVFGKYEGRKPFIPPLDIINDYSAENVSLVYEEYYKTIRNKMVISFDVFDTLVNRPFIKPTDIFVYMENKYNCIGFTDNRVKAEKKARESLKKEVNLNDIYSFVSGEYKYLKELEIETEIKMCHCNEMIRPVYEYAKKQNKRVIAVSDMYHSRDTIKTILFNLGYEMDEIYVSCDYNMTKGNGDLYRKVLELETINVNDVVHFGDNYLSDFSQAKTMGIDAYQTPKSLDYLFNSNKNSYCMSYTKKHNDLASSIHLSLIAEYLNNRNDNYYKRLGYVFGGPLSLGYLNFVCSNAAKDNIDKLLFVSRDGYSLIEIYKKYLFDCYKTDYAYAYLSRAAIFSGNSENGLCNDLKKFLEIIKVSISKILIHDNKEENIEEYQKNRETIDTLSKNRSENLKKHLEEICQGNSCIATVDMVSGNFTSYKGAKYYLKDRIKKGFFAGSFASKKEGLSFYCSRLLGMRDNLPVKLSELLISSPESPIIGVDENGKAIYEYSEDNKRVDRYNSIMEGIYMYCGDYFNYFEADGKLLIGFDEWLDLSSTYLYECSDEDITVLAEIVDSENPVSKDTDKSFKQLIEEYRTNGY